MSCGYMVAVGSAVYVNAPTVGLTTAYRFRYRRVLRMANPELWSSVKVISRRELGSIRVDRALQHIHTLCDILTTLLQDTRVWSLYFLARHTSSI
jgi:hypothetical protein